MGVEKEGEASQVCVCGGDMSSEGGGSGCAARASQRKVG